MQHTGDRKHVTNGYTEHRLKKRCWHQLWYSFRV